MYASRCPGHHIATAIINAAAIWLDRPGCPLSRTLDTMNPPGLLSLEAADKSLLGPDGPS